VAILESAGKARKSARTTEWWAVAISGSGPKIDHRCNGGNPMPKTIVFI